MESRKLRGMKCHIRLFQPETSSLVHDLEREQKWYGQGKTPNSSSWCPNLHVCYSNTSMFSSTIKYIHLILYIQSTSGTVKGCFKTRWWLHKRRKTSATTGLPKPRTCCLCLNSSISWYRHESKGCTILAQPGGASQLVNGSKPVNKP